MRGDPTAPQDGSGPLAGLRVVELAGLGSAPFATMYLADHGADVVRVDGPNSGFVMPIDPRLDTLQRGKRSVTADLKDPDQRLSILELISHADVLVEGYRPGVAERLGLGPQECLSRNPRLVFGRITGWGQDGPLSARAGHDPTYQAITGALHAIGPADGPPQLPLSLIGDFGGGAMYLVAGILAALHWVHRTGVGQVVDAAVVDGVSHLMANPYSLLAGGAWRDQRGANLIDGGAPFVSVYETADGLHVAVAALEPPFFAELLRGLDLAEQDVPGQWDEAAWPRLRSILADTFRTRTRDEWASAFVDKDACVAPILSMHEAPSHPHLLARATFVTDNGYVEPAAAPRFSVTESSRPRPVSTESEPDIRQVSAAWAAARPTNQQID